MVGDNPPPFILIKPDGWVPQPLILGLLVHRTLRIPVHHKYLRVSFIF